MIKIAKEDIRQKLLTYHNNLLNRETIDKAELGAVLKDILADTIYHRHLNITEQDKAKIISEMIDELMGFGPIETLMKDPEVTEIMINGAQKVYIEKNGKKILSGLKFDDEQQLRCLIYKLLAPTRRRVDESYPFVDVSLKDGSRVNIIIPPLALDGASVTIRKFSESIKSIDDLIRLEALDRRMADFLIALIKAKMNILFSGATGAGKTTTLAVLSAYIDNDERIVTIEDTAELHLKQEHVVRLETRPPNIEGKGEVAIRDLFKNSLRMRPGRIILGEIRGSEALDMLQAMCSGHAGSLAVLHANSPKEVVYRLETMILTSGLPISLDVIHRQIASALNIIVHQEQLSDGSRKITHITQVNGLKDGSVVLEDIFNYESSDVGQDGRLQGKFKANGVVPVLFPLFAKKGVNLSKEIFNKD
ncbi:MAG: CpaF family protein [Candidatus Omnitrophota bacterium]